VRHYLASEYKIFWQGQIRTKDTGFQNRNPALIIMVYPNRLIKIGIRIPLLILLRMAGMHTTYVYLTRILRDGCRYGVIQERRSEDDASDIL
jgi:hypothetical protein